MNLIDCSDRMIDAIHEYGIIPFFRCPVAGWSIQEMTAPGCWFDENGADGVLGPWDWKVDAVNGGGIAYGKFLGGKAAFATSEWYGHLMNWRRSLPKYRMALGERYPVRTQSEKLMKYLAPVALNAIKDAGALGSKELRYICSSALTPYQLRTLGAKYRPLLTPALKKNVMDSVIGFLQMGTWSVIGEIERVYRGPNLTYSGWQLASNTTPEGLFGEPSDNAVSSDEIRPAGSGVCPDGGSGKGDAMPSWASRFMDEAEVSPLQVTCTPEESRERIISHIQSLFPHADRFTLEKLV